MFTRIGVALLALLSVVATVGCGSGETDPHMKVDDPGYYNGPMQPHGANKSGGQSQ